MAIAEQNPAVPDRVACAPSAAKESQTFPLRRALVVTDTFAIATAWLLVLGVSTPGHWSVATRLAGVAAIVLFTMGMLTSHHLYLSRICRIRALEISRLARATAVAGLGTYLATGRVSLGITSVQLVWGTVASFVLLTWSRGAYASWVGRRRQRGLSTRPVVIVGNNDEAHDLKRLLDGHAELGLAVVAVVERPAAVSSTLRRHRADSVIIAVSGFQPKALNALTRELLDAGVHVHLSCGLAGIDHRRLRPSPMAHEPLFYLERATSSAWQRAVSRALDIVGSIVGLILSAPVLVVVAVAIKLHDRGPVFFSHERVGKDGEPFMLHKLRTMVPNAEACLPLVESANRRDGPLFKSDSDPRVTPIGRVLRATSLDELPQLFNVLKGTMSLVGPRPALAREVAQFDAELLTRHRVRPGITGLWQVEARNDPAFDSYRRLDLFYLENWSLTLDVVILVATVKGLLGQAVDDLRGKWRAGTLAHDSFEFLDGSMSSPSPVPAR